MSCGVAHRFLPTYLLLYTSQLEHCTLDAASPIGRTQKTMRGSSYCLRAEHGGPAVSEGGFNNTRREQGLRSLRGPRLLGGPSCPL